MAEPTKNLRIRKTSWKGLKKLSEKHDKSMAKIFDDLIHQELDPIFGYQRPKKRS